MHKKYYDITEGAMPHKNVRKVLSFGIVPGMAIELGCGAGRDTAYLIQNGWDVFAVDKENTEEYILKKLTVTEREKLKFYQGSFDEISFENCNLVVANYSLPFCDKEKFQNVWKNIENSIQNDGYFVGNFFGLNDSWKEEKTRMTFLEKQEVINLFDKFDIIEFREIDEYGKTANGKLKHWHVYFVIAKKKDCTI